MKKIALITGITGQDGSYLAEFLLKKIMQFMGSRENPHRLIQVEQMIFILTHIKNLIFFYIMEI